MSGNNQQLIEEIKQLRKQRNAVILAHNYQRSEVQDIADYVGDSLGLSRQAAKTDAKVIVFCGVCFMAETAYIISPDKTVVLPAIDAGCPLADMASLEALRAKKEEFKNYAVVTYINSSAAIKAESDICCTSSNVVDIINKIPAEKILFVPDKNLALWAKKQTGKEIIIWPGFCITHQRLKVTDIEEVKKNNKEAEFMAHPECTPEVLEFADFVGSTSAMFKYGRESKAQTLIVGSEMGMLHRLKKENPTKKFILASKQLVCANMKKTTLVKVRNALLNLEPKVTVEENTRKKALAAVQRMLEVG